MKCVAECMMYDERTNMAFFVRKRERSMMMMRRIVVLLLLLLISSSSVVVDGLDSKKKSQEVIKDDGPDIKFHTHYFTAKEKTNQNGVVRIGALSPIYLMKNKIFFFFYYTKNAHTTYRLCRYQRREIL
jgi:hypothetical protein